MINTLDARGSTEDGILAVSEPLIRKSVFLAREKVIDEICRELKEKLKAETEIKLDEITATLNKSFGRDLIEIKLGVNFCNKCDHNDR